MGPRECPSLVAGRSMSLLYYESGKGGPCRFKRLFFSCLREGSRLPSLQSSPRTGLPFPDTDLGPLCFFLGTFPKPKRRASFLFFFRDGILHFALVFCGDAGAGLGYQVEFSLSFFRPRSASPCSVPSPRPAPIFLRERVFLLFLSPGRTPIPA